MVRIKFSILADLQVCNYSSSDIEPNIAHAVVTVPRLTRGALRLCFVASGLLQGSDEFLFSSGSVLERVRDMGRISCNRVYLGRQMFRLNRAAVLYHCGIFQSTFQLTHISGPLVFHQLAHGFRGRTFVVVEVVDYIDEMIHQQGQGLPFVRAGAAGVPGLH